ncbi:MAG: hypothetical protein HC896_06435 [Bacteroidales bacterium]|nr:hypothetical protein [Bacteroidales bacterium]
MPLNGLRFGFDIKDNVKPVPKALCVYPLDTLSAVEGQNRTVCFDLVKDGEFYYIPGNKRIYVWGNIGLGAEAYDYLDGSSNRCGLYELQMKVNGQLYYQHFMEGIPFDKAGYVRSHVDYAMKQKNNKSVQKLFKDSNNKLGIYSVFENDGAITVDTDTLFTASIIMSDAYNNSSELKVKFAGKPWTRTTPAKMPENYIKTLDHSKENYFVGKDVKVKFPAYSLF